MAIITNLDTLVGNASASYILAHSEDFRSTVQGPKGDIGLTGAQGTKGDAGVDGEDLTVEQIQYNGNGTFTWQFSDGTSYTTPNMIGPQGLQGSKGAKGDTGTSVHHTKGTSTTDSEGDFSTPGEYDTYTMYGDAAETEVLGWFTVANGDSAYTSAKKGGYIGTEEEFQISLGALTELITEVGDAVDNANSALAQVANKVSYDDITSDLTLTVEDKVLSAKAGKTLKDTITGLTAANIAETATKKIMTDVERTKLAGIETGATADQTGTEIKSLYEAQTGKILDNVTRIGLNGTNTVGQMTWNATEQTADLVLSSDVTLQLGQELLARVRNNSGSTITNGTVVMVTGALGASGNMTVSPHDGTRANGRKIAGLATHDIANGVDGLTLLRGKIRGLDTTGNPVGETWLEGDWLFVKPNDGGKLTKVEPADNELKMPVGIVLNVHANNGTLQIRTTGTDENAFKDWVNTKLAVTEW